MIVDEEQETGPQRISPELVWRNSRSRVNASLRDRKKHNPYCRWAEQASKIRARPNWDTNHVWGS